MKSGLFLMAGLALMSAFTACSNDDEMKAVAQAEGTPLVVQSVGVAEVGTKAGITAGSFSGSETIGLYIYTGAKGTLSGAYNTASSSIPTVNVPYTQGNPWTAAQPIILSSTTGVVYGYYPHSGSAGDGSAVPVSVAADQGTGQSAGTADASEQADYMYATAVENISNKSARIATLTMNHALAMITFKFVQTSDDNIKYPGAGKVSKIILKNVDNTKSALKTGDGRMNIYSGATTGGVATVSSQPASITVQPSTETTLMGETAAAKLPRILVYPNTAVAAGDVEAIITVDGNDYKVPIPALTSTTGWNKGVNYTYTFTLKGTELQVTNVSIAPWVDKAEVGGDIQTPA